MRTTWRATCLGLLVLGPLLTACGGDDDARTEPAAPASPAPTAPATGVYGQPDPDAPEPTDVATDTPTPPTATADPGGAGNQVAPRLTYFGWNAAIRAVEAGGIVPAVVEAGGTCTLTLSQGAAEVSVSSEGIDNVTSTACGEMLVPADRLSPGAWRTVLTYESGTSRGTSEATEVLVP